MARSRLLPDNFTLTLIAVVVTATLLPARGQVAVAFDWITNIAIGLLFFLHGAKLSREAVIAGAGHWRLHLLVFLCTFGLFPLLGLALKPVLLPLVGAELYTGFLYLCALPATVQSAIAFTSLARGNIPAAVEQFQIALKTGQGDFYQLSATEARLRELRRLHDELRKEQGKPPVRDK